ncbi:MAG: hypothetical protein K6B75_00290 [Lachnospiraceae bacterium]|nr:hypothetical protein [Lachnospiraceae bacterium]
MVKYTCLRSGLTYNDDLKRKSDNFIKGLGSLLKEELVLSDLSDYDCDLKLIFVQTGGSENTFLQNKDLLKPPYYLLTNGFNNSLAASLEIMTYINSQGLQGEILHGSSEYIVSRIKELLVQSKVINGLKESRFGVLGHPSDWLISSVPQFELVKEKLGITFENISLEEVKTEFNKSVIVDKDKLPGVFSSEEKIKALRTYNAFKKIAESRKLSGFTVRCFDLLRPLETTGCAGLALLNDEGITSTCEGDIAALISMHIVRLLTGEPSFQANPSVIDPDANTAVLAHCTLPLSMSREFKLDTHFESGTGIAIKGYLSEEDVTVFRLSADLKRFFVSNGRIVRNLEEPDLCRTQILIKFEEDVTELLKHPCGNHHIVFYGHYAKEIRSLMKEML